MEGDDKDRFLGKAGKMEAREEKGVYPLRI